MSNPSGLPHNPYEFYFGKPRLTLPAEQVRAARRANQKDRDWTKISAYRPDLGDTR